MPKRKGRWDFVKLYRPVGARHAHGRTEPSYQEAIFSAFVAWADEFTDNVRIEDTIIEVIGVTGGYAATIWEIKG